MYEKFTNQYSVSKVLRFSLIPQGKTKENIEKNGLIEEDEKRAESYKIVKQWLDQFHKKFIDRVMDDFKLEGLDKYLELYNSRNRSDNEEKELENLKGNLRKQISSKFNADDEFKGMFGKDIIKDYLPKVLKDSADLCTIKEFDNFTTYFTGFFQNRKNMYTDEDQSTSIAHRLITQNLPKFIDNMHVYDMVKKHNSLITHILENEKNLNEFKNETFDEVFSIEYFNNVLTNRGIQLYNALIGGYTDENQKKIQGINEYINLYNQQLKHGEVKVPKLKPLYKQILADREELSFIAQKIESDAEVIEALRELSSIINGELNNPIAGISIKQMFSSWEDYKLEKIFIKNDASITNISQQLYGNWNVISEGLNHIYDEEFIGKIKNREAYVEERAKQLKKHKGFDLQLLNEAASRVVKSNLKVENFFESFGYKENVLDGFQKNYELAQELLLTDYPLGKHLKKDDQNVEIMKNLLDSMMAIHHLLKMFFIPEGDKDDKDEKFYYELDRLQNVLDSVVPVYNQIRNYITSKPYSTNKIKLNFNNPRLLHGWDKNKERDNTSVILKRDGKYYLGIMNKKSNNIFIDKDIPQNSLGECYKKMEYKLLHGPNEMFPKVFFSKSRIDEFSPSADVIRIRDTGTFKKGPNFSKKDCHTLIDFFKESISRHEDWCKFDFKFSDTKQYNDISEFYREVESQNYKLNFVDISKEYIDNLVDEGKLFLFQIYSKDFSSYSHGKKNLHTIYWKMLFDEQNLRRLVYKLNGEAEIFYRKASLPVKVTHPANKPIVKKIPNSDGKYEDSIFEYDLIKDRRYTMDKFQFHVPVTLNYTAQGRDNINEYAKNVLHDEERIYSIGIDRGERNLLYISVVDSDGKVVHQESLNTIMGDKGNKQNYHRLLSEREAVRDKARKNWQSIEGIKDLKEGYLSQVVHRVAQLMIEYQAIVVLEDLNFGFMRGRQKVERQVYQKFEKTLIDKLNYLVNKELDVNEQGGALNAYQLTSRFTSFQRLGKQSGLLFYIPAWNTSKMDPTTGFVNLLYPKYTSVSDTKKYIGKFKKICYNKWDDYFEFSFDYNDFTEKAEGTKTDWTICSYGERIENFRNPERNSEWDYRKVDLTLILKNLLDEYNISYKSGEDVKEKIVELDNGGKEFYEKLMHILKLILQIRNSIANTDDDYLLSPVKNAKGEFYCSKNAPDYLPLDADGNGAYNIARKGLWVWEQLRKTPEDELHKVKLAISNKEWMTYAQSHTVV